MALHTDIPTRTEIERLVSASPSHCVSIYLPTHRVTQETTKDRLVLRDLAEQAVEHLRDAGADSDDIEEIESHLMHLVDDDDDFWADQADSLAIFASPNRFETHRLPNDLKASVHVSDRFHITPLLRSVSFPHAAWVLAISQGAVRLLEISPSGAPEEVHVPDMPKDAWESSGNKVHRAREAGYARRVDVALRDVLTGSDLPLILSASQPMAALFRSVNTYPHLVAEREHGNPETTSDAELADAARAILDDVYADQITDLAKLFDERRSQGRTAVDLTDLARLATLGAIDTVLVDIDRSVPGSIDDAGAVTFADDDSGETGGVIGEIVRRVLKTDGRVLAVRGDDIPEGAPAAAILRYVI
jgi:hypothetical protein